MPIVIKSFRNSFLQDNSELPIIQQNKKVTVRLKLLFKNV